MGGLFDLDKKNDQIKELEAIQNKEDFWLDINEATKINKKITTLKKELEEYQTLYNTVVDNLELINIVEEKDLIEINKELSTTADKIASLEVKTLLNGEWDDYSCYLEIHPGAGGTESCDWASMLLRMYERFCEKNNYTYEIIEEQKGEEAGIKSATLLISGEYAYGYFKREKGVHRLVRISPFDAGKRRHTSFASVSVTPQINQEVDLDIKESDLKIDVYHSSGAGGQSVNTSNSAVRITHLPTKTVVTCQNERSQLKNKEQALKLLKSKLYQKEIEKKEEKLNILKGTEANIDFGSQIRNYVLEPYKQVKDLRSGYVTSNAEKVLDGDILEIMKSLLKEGNYE